MINKILNFFKQKPKEISEFEQFKIKKIAKLVYQMNYDLTLDRHKARQITISQLQEIYEIDKKRFSELYTKHLRIG